MGTPHIPRPRVSREYVEAIAPLHGRREAAGTSTPCERDPELWDDREIGESYDNMMFRTLAAIDRCMECTALVECINFRTLNAELPVDERVYGVLGGVLVTASRPMGRPSRA
jgi:hypothetical protein